MPGVIQELPHGAAVAIVRLRSLGDCVLTTPALAILKQARPDLRIAVVAEERFSEVFVPNPDVDEVLPPSVAAIRRWRPELCMNLHGGTRSIALTGASGARWRAGYEHFRASAIYNVIIPKAQDILGVERKVHTAEHVASAMFYLGAPRGPIPRARLYATEAPRRLKPTLLIHPVAATQEKTWPAARFLAVARQLAAEYEPVFIGGPGDDLSAFSEFQTIVGAPLQETKELLAGASLFLGNDSGPAHMAAAFGVPVVVLFGPSDPIVWAPWQVESRVFTGTGGDIAAIAVDEVAEALTTMRVKQ